MGFDHWELGFCYWKFALSGSQISVLLQIPDIKYFMQSSCIPGHCHVRVRTILMLTDLFLNLKALTQPTTSLPLIQLD